MIVFVGTLVYRVLMMLFFLFAFSGAFMFTNAAIRINNFIPDLF